MAQLHRTWFIYSQGETFGPLSTDVVMLMIKQKRLEYWDFIWTQGLDAWARVADMMPFSELLPSYPDAPIPGDAGEGTIPNPTQGKAAAPTPVSPPTPDPSHSKVPPAAPAHQPEPAPGTAPGNAPGNADGKPKTGRAIRRHGRAKIVGTADIAEYQTYPVYDIAEGGIFVIAEPPLPVGISVKFKLISDSFAKPMNMTGIVIRLGSTEEGQMGFGIQFTRVNPAYSRIIRDYVSAHQND